jgi:hypothetical protein
MKLAWRAIDGWTVLLSGVSNRLIPHVQRDGRGSDSSRDCEIFKDRVEACDDRVTGNIALGLQDNNDRVTENIALRLETNNDTRRLKMKL